MSSARLSIVTISLLLFACDGGFQIRGSAPDDGRCVVKVFEDESEHPYKTFNVRGQFNEVVMFGGWSRSEWAVTAECNGRSVKALLHLNPRYEEPVELGTLEP